MRKPKEITLGKISADDIAKNLKKANGLDRARHIADYYTKTLKGIGAEDVNPDFFSVKSVRKSERIWTQVSDILAKQKH